MFVDTVTECASVQVKVPLLAMKGGIDLQKYVDVLLPAAPATIKIVQVTYLSYIYVMDPQPSNSSCSQLS